MLFSPNKFISHRTYWLSLFRDSRHLRVQSEPFLKQQHIGNAVYKNNSGDKEHRRFLHSQFFPFLWGCFLLLAASHLFTCQGYWHGFQPHTSVGLAPALRRKLTELSAAQGGGQTPSKPSPSNTAVFPEPCGATTEGSQIPSGNGYQQTSLLFEFVIQNIVKSFQIPQPV